MSTLTPNLVRGLFIAELSCIGMITNHGIRISDIDSHVEGIENIIPVYYEILSHSARTQPDITDFLREKVEQWCLTMTSDKQTQGRLRSFNEIRTDLHKKLMALAA